MSNSPTAAVRDRQTTVISQDFLSTRFSLQRKTGHTCYLNIFLIYNFEELLECLAMSDLVLLTCYFLTKINFILQLYIYYIYKYIYTIYILYIYYVYILYILYIYIFTTFRNSPIQFVKSFLLNNSRPRTLQEIEFEMESRVSQ